MGDVLGEVPIIGQQEQALGVEIQAAHRKEARAHPVR
jgi:hypothetical protein